LSSLSKCCYHAVLCRRCFHKIYLTGKDVCEETVSSGSLRKGHVTWPVTEVGRRVSVRCPYAYDQPLFVSRDCILADARNSSGASWSPWSAVENMDVCPDPPFTRQVLRLHRRLVIICIRHIIVLDALFEIIHFICPLFLSKEVQIFQKLSAECSSEVMVIRLVHR